MHQNLYTPPLPLTGRSEQGRRATAITCINRSPSLDEEQNIVGVPLDHQQVKRSLPRPVECINIDAEVNEEMRRVDLINNRMMQRGHYTLIARLNVCALLDEQSIEFHILFSQS